jgi:hypothetical protein
LVARGYIHSKAVELIIAVGQTENKVRWRSKYKSRAEDAIAEISSATSEISRNSIDRSWIFVIGIQTDVFWFDWHKSGSPQIIKTLAINRVNLNENKRIISPKPADFANSLANC